MKRIAVVVQRCGRDITGGSEGYALKMAGHLSRASDVEILTTTARDYVTWRNFYEEGTERLSDTLRIRRFSVDFERDRYWHELNRVLFRALKSERFLSLDPEEKRKFIERIEKTPLGLQEEWVRAQGPSSSGLMKYIGENEARYDVFIFMTYLYPTTYFGVEAVKNREKVFLVPTFHDEPPAYLPVYRKYARLRHLFLTEAEKRLANGILGGFRDSHVIGFGLDDRFGEIEPAREESPYILYAGRLDAVKGLGELFEYFERYARERAGLRLYTIGDGELKNYKGEAVSYRGFLGEEEKLSLMKGALALVHPSSLESLGIVLLEAFMMATPAVVNGRSAVLRGHVEASGGGFFYEDYEGLERALDSLMASRPLRDDLGTKARRYFLENYSTQSYRQTLLSIIAGGERAVGLQPPRLEVS